MGKIDTIGLSYTPSAMLQGSTTSALLSRRCFVVLAKCKLFCGLNAMSGYPVWP